MSSKFPGCKECNLYIGENRNTPTSYIVEFRVPDQSTCLKFNYYDIDVTMDLKIDRDSDTLEVSVSFCLDTKDYPPNTYTSLWIGNSYDLGPTRCWKIVEGRCSETWKGEIPPNKKIAFFVYC